MWMGFWSLCVHGTHILDRLCRQIDARGVVPMGLQGRVVIPYGWAQRSGRAAMSQGSNSPQEKKDWDLGESTVGSTEVWRDSVGI